MPEQPGPPAPPGASPKVVAVLGASGFIGGAVVAALRARGIVVRPLAAPRLRWPRGRPYDERALATGVRPAGVRRLAGQLVGTQAVVNAAGQPDGNAPAGASLFGANALLPTLVARACVEAGVPRLVHLSSAAVQGGDPDRPLDETPDVSPFSPYSRSKALGERLLLAEPAPQRVVFRSTWVHHPGRRNTVALVKLARSRASCVAGDGTAPTPQVLRDDIAASVVHLVLTAAAVPPIVLQPGNGMTTGELLRLLGGHEPRHIPQWVARAAVRAMRGYGRLGRGPNAHARRLELLLFGRAQVEGWLAGQGVVPELDPVAWRRLAGRPIVPAPAGPRQLRQRV